MCVLCVFFFFFFFVFRIITVFDQIMHCAVRLFQELMQQNLYQCFVISHGLNKKEFFCLHYDNNIQPG